MTKEMKKNLKIFLSAAFLIMWLALVILLLVRPASNECTPLDHPPTDDDVNAIATRLFCPICENTPLDVCPTEACHDWRELIREMLAEGKCEAEIEQFFVDYYGARVLSAPPAKGINWLAYIVPPVFFLIGAFLFYRTFQPWKRIDQAEALDLNHDVPSKMGSAAEAKEINDYAARLEEELKKRE